MERGSDKHSGRVDDAMKGETSGMVAGNHDSRAEEWRSAEPSGDDQPAVSRGADNAMTGGVPEGMEPADVAARSELASWLGRASFPAVREQLLGHVMDEAAPDHVIELVRRLPAGREFVNAGEVWRALHEHDRDGEHVESQRF
jgi:hypothetical protein